MADEIRLKATKDLGGFSARLVGGYKTRRLKAGDEFYVDAKLGEFLVEKLKKAEYNREAGKIAAPPPHVVEKVAEAAPAKVEEPEEEPKPVAAASTRSTAADKPKRATTTRKRPTTRRTAKKG